MATIPLTRLKRLKDAPAFFNLNQWRIEPAEKLYREVINYHPAEVVCKVYQYEETGPPALQCEGVEVRILHPYLDFRIDWSQYNKRYRISCRDISRLHNLGRSYSASSYGLKEPLQIGKLSAAKIDSWIKFYEAYYRKLYQVNEENKAKIEAFRRSLHGLPVDWYNDRRGFIKLNGLEFTFTIHDTGQIEENISIPYHTGHNLSTFLKLSDNKFSPQPEQD